MVIYLDVVILINFVFDLFLLETVNSILKRHTKLWKMILSSLFGGISILALFLDFNTITLFIFKIIISIVMILISFGYKNFIKDFYYLYFCSIVLGGFMYFLNTQLSYKNNGLIFAYNGLSVNVITIFVLGPLILISYIKQTKELKIKYTNYYNCELYIDSKHRIKINAFLDTGNKLKDPYSNKSIILINKDLIDIKNKDPVYVPYNTLNNHGLLKCYKGTKIIINNHLITNYLLGISDNKIGIEGIDCIINNEIIEEIQ